MYSAGHADIMKHKKDVGGESMLTLDMVREAQEALRGIARRTPLDRAPKFGENVYIKAENLQLTGAFKLRGAYNKIRSLTPEEAARGVIACSAGNHAQGIALSASRLGIKAVICMPAGAPISKVEATRGYGAEVVLVPGVYDDAAAEAERLTKEQGYTFAHPFNDPLVIAGHLVGFVLCGQVRLSNDIELVDILNVDDRWQDDPALVQAFRDVPEMDYSRVIASADLLKLIVENCLKKQLNFVVIKDNPPQNDPAQASRAASPHDGKMKKALRYIDAHLSDELRLEDVAAHVYLSPYYFSKLFKKYQGIGFNAWVNQQRMASAKELLCHSDWSIASIARNLGFSQTSYFCKVFRQTYQVTPQAFRQQINAGSQTESF